ncbi:MULTISPECIES: hypothetical protein [unclassified Streptomyces]|uniref:hypothetical protein n=1 Tax=unclassified Streptomyces TaxID=2593676 RepID=UPI0022500593|nr:MULTISPECIES: hypothetical protein [unclassified Streptomyces]MCX5103876.1 hypothetical protein [Streptomyces sp. NBC_00439]WSC31987.1 hypothetical protein OG902_37720 [Streptomyces sp. NBC_01768]WSX06019.1 hypothetical protein OG355_39285 [Streptomyces sp. NBC_00987]
MAPALNPLTPKQARPDDFRPGLLGLEDLLRLAMRIQDLYDELILQERGRGWIREEFVLGFVGDFGDLAKFGPLRTTSRTTPPTAKAPPASRMPSPGTLKASSLASPKAPRPTDYLKRQGPPLAPMGDEWEKDLSHQG